MQVVHWRETVHIQAMVLLTMENLKYSQIWTVAGFYVNFTKQNILLGEAQQMMILTLASNAGAKRS